MLYIYFDFSVLRLLLKNIILEILLNLLYKCCTRDIYRSLWTYAIVVLGLMDSSGGSSTGGTEGEGSASTHPSPRRDPSSFTLVEAAQYGVLRRCIELVEEQGASVTRGDDEDITVLHWAAINNRLDVAR